MPSIVWALRGRGQGVDHLLNLYVPNHSDTSDFQHFGGTMVEIHCILEPYETLYSFFSRVPEDWLSRGCTTSNFSHVEVSENPVLQWNVVVLLGAIEEFRIDYL